MLRRAGLAVAFLLAGVPLSARQPPSPLTSSSSQPSSIAPSPTFKLGVDYVEVDALVTDKQGNFVRGLTKNDFQIFEDGKPQAISAFSVVDIPTAQTELAQRPVKATAAIQPDVASNAKPFDGRLYVMIVDDLHTPPDQTQRLVATAKRFVEQNLGADDLMAVVHTIGSSTVNQAFTGNKSLLLDAIDKTSGRGLGSAALNTLNATLFPATAGGTGMPEPEFDAQQVDNARATYDTIRRIASQLANVRNRRKAILLVSEGIDYNIANLAPNTALSARINVNAGSSVDPQAYALSVFQAMHAAIDAAARNNVAVYGIDPRGLAFNNAEQDIEEGTAHPSLAGEVRLGQNSLRTISKETGGFAIVDRNTLDKGYQRIVAENSSYYVLAYYPATEKHDGKFHKIEVRVDRPGVTVNARKGYLAPKLQKGKTAANAGDGMSSALEHALSSPIPVTGLTMHVFAAPFKGAAADPSVLFGLELTGRDLALTAGDKVDISYLAMDTAGRVRDHTTYAVTLNLDPASRARIEQHGMRLLNRLNLPPGNYQLRVAAEDEASGRVGSVVDTIEVPDFSKAPLVLSGVVMTSALGAFTPTPRPDAKLRSVLPASPVALREFPQNDAVVVYGEAYDNQPATPHKVSLTTTVTTADGHVAFKTADERESSELHGQPGGYGFTAQIPMKGLPVGRYLLTVAAQSESGHPASVSREIPFTVVAPVALAGQGQ